MGRKGNADRGIYQRTLPSGKTTYYIRFAWQGRDIRLKGGATKEKARQTLRRTLADLERGTVTITPRAHDTVLGAIERYRPIGQRKRNYQKTQAFYVWWTERFGTIPLCKLTPAKIEQAQERLIQSGKSPATVNRYTDWLRHILNREVRLGHMANNPVTNITRLAEADAPIHQYSHEQEHILIQTLGEYGPWVRLAILTGLRQAEQFRLEKEWINWEAGYIQLPTSKANRPKIVVLTNEVRTILRELCDRHPQSPFVFPSPKHANKPMNPGAWYRKTFMAALKKAKLPPTMKWHTLRHTGGSRLAASGANAHQIKAWGGWSTDRASNRYIHLAMTDLREVAERLSGAQKSGTMPSLRKSKTHTKPAH